MHRNLYSVYASAQLITQHPVLCDPLEARVQYYEYLEHLVRDVSRNRKRNTKERLAFYRDTLCGDEFVKGRKNMERIAPYCFLLPFDLAILWCFDWDRIPVDKLSRTIIADFHLSRQNAEKFLRMDFEAALGHEELFNQILANDSLKEYAWYMNLVRDNVHFINQTPYPILFTATMSAGKSTLINALVGKTVSLAQSLAATSKIHAIVAKPFEDGIATEYDRRLTVNAARDKLMQADLSDRTERVVVSTCFDGALRGERLVLLDSPGVNSHRNPAHRERAQQALCRKQYKLLIYIMNADQLNTNDDDAHLEFVAKTLASGRKKVLFVINKIDQFSPADGELAHVMLEQKAYLTSKGFRDPMLCPVSAKAGELWKRSQTGELDESEQLDLGGFRGKLEYLGLCDYYEKMLGCPVLPPAGGKKRNVYELCGLPYLEGLILKYKKGEM